MSFAKEDTNYLTLTCGIQQSFPAHTTKVSQFKRFWSDLEDSLLSHIASSANVLPFPEREDDFARLLWDKDFLSHFCDQYCTLYVY